jgi:hypothetical protein
MKNGCKKIAWIIAAAGISLTVTTGILRAETVFLKDGMILDGSIVSEAAGTVKVRLKDKTTKVVPRTNILRVLYTELYMGKQYVQKVDGKGIICYVVDEDKDTFTFRMELYNPQEFKLKRSEILFMARGNPSGLEGEAKTDSAALKWFAPYNEVKYYKIYARAASEKDFAMVDESRSKSAVVKKLKSNTKYVFYVTAIDTSGDESLPSNELTISTVNLPPTSPKIDPVVTMPNGDIKVTWNLCTDPDGKLTGYKVYNMTDGKSEVIADLKTPGYTIPNGTKYDYIYVSAYDDLKAESDRARVFIGYVPSLGISIHPGIIVPFGDLADAAKMGYGAGLKFDMSNYFMTKLELKAETGFFYLPGKKKFAEKENAVNSVIIVPMMINGGYSFYPVTELSFTPYLGAGAAFVRYDYAYFGIPESKKVNTAENDIDFALSAGVDARYIWRLRYYFGASVDYKIMFEKSRKLMAHNATFCAGMWF